MDRRRQIRSAFWPPPLVAGLLCAELVVFVVLLAIGVPWLKILTFAGLPIGITLGLLGPTFQELGRRQPKLEVSAADGEGVLQARARPWPFDRARVIANEVADANASAENRNQALDNFFGLGQPMAVRPSAAEHERARAAFTKEVAEFGTELGGWLDDYLAAARAYADTFEVTLTLGNADSGAFAEDVTVTIELADGVESAPERPEISPPPERPYYEPPRPRIPLYEGPGVRFSPDTMRDFARVLRRPAEVALHGPVWTQSGDGRRIETKAGDIHAGRSVAVGEPLFLRAPGPGSHVLRWSAYTKSGRRAARGTITLEVPADPLRPAFGRLAGITAYPDVPLVDEDGEERREVRQEDPPPRPQPEDSSGDAFAAIRATNALWQWKALGLDPADDGPEEVIVERAEPSGRSNA